MSWKQKLRNPVFQQYALELLLPIVGFFIFDWSLLLIGIYFLLDHFVSQFFFYKRSISVRDFHGSKDGIGIMVVSIIFFMGVFLLEIALLTTLVLHVQDLTTDILLDEFWKLSKEELWFLIPLVFFAYYLKDKMSFYRSRAFVYFDFGKMIKWDLLSQFILIIILTICIVIWMMYFTHAGWIIVSFIIGKILFDLLLKSMFLNKSLRKVN